MKVKGSEEDLSEMNWVQLCKREAWEGEWNNRAVSSQFKKTSYLQ